MEKINYYLFLLILVVYSMLEQKQLALKEYESEIGSMLSEFMEKYGDQWRRLGEDE